MDIRTYKTKLSKLDTSNDFQPSTNLKMDVYDTIMEHEDITRAFLSEVVPCIINANK